MAPAGPPVPGADPVDAALRASQALEAAASVWAQGQDTWTLLPRKLTNRDLRGQLEAEPYRLGLASEHLVVAADGTVGTEVARQREDLTRYHGFFIVDAYAEVELVHGVDLNLDLTSLNASASDGYRFSTQLLPGAALHLHWDAGEVAGAPLRLDFVAPDLDLVTVGRGLMVEETPLEGFAAGARWGGLELRTVFGGRVFWQDDDLLATTISALGGAVGLSWVHWMTELLPPPLSYPGMQPSLQLEEPLTYGRDVAADYLTLFADVSPWKRVRLSGEYGVRLAGSVRQALLGRVDVLVLDAGPWALHAGYQLRYYGEGFGPRRRLVTASTAPQLPYRENTYVTNSFEYLGISHDFEQWSHTLVAEAEVPVWSRVVLFADGELWLRWIRDAGDRVVYVEHFGRAPGSAVELYGRAGLRVYPSTESPWRLAAFVTNKLVAAHHDAQTPSAARIVTPTVLELAAEVFL